VGAFPNRFRTGSIQGTNLALALGPDAQLRSCALVTPVPGSAFKTVLGPHFSAHPWRAQLLCRR
jgi:hypothetical protein